MCFHWSFVCRLCRTINFSNAPEYACLCLFVIESVYLSAYASGGGRRKEMKRVGEGRLEQCSAGVGRAVGWQMPEGFIRHKRGRPWTAVLQEVDQTQTQTHTHTLWFWSTSSFPLSLLSSSVCFSLCFPLFSIIPTHLCPPSHSPMQCTVCCFLISHFSQIHLFSLFVCLPFFLFFFFLVASVSEAEQSLFTGKCMQREKTPRGWGFSHSARKPFLSTHSVERDVRKKREQVQQTQPDTPKRTHLIKNVCI